MRRSILILIVYQLAIITSIAKVRLPTFFCDNMVLQQQTECFLWGWAEPGKKVHVITPWDKKSYMVTARNDGHFGVMVKTPKAGGPYSIIF
ncbi:MAG: sialate O-acetylesterase, partial [Prevotella sp.]|nr:sialate O-acetylesterase [Prevotella sp.]